MWFWAILGNVLGTFVIIVGLLYGLLYLLALLGKAFLLGVWAMRTFFQSVACIYSNINWKIAAQAAALLVVVVVVGFLLSFGLGVLSTYLP